MAGDDHRRENGRVRSQELFCDTASPAWHRSLDSRAGRLSGDGRRGPTSLRHLVPHPDGQVKRPLVSRRNSIRRDRQGRASGLSRVRAGESPDQPLCADSTISPRLLHDSIFRPPDPSSARLGPRLVTMVAHTRSQPLGWPGGQADAVGVPRLPVAPGTVDAPNIGVAEAPGPGGGSVARWSGGAAAFLQEP